MSAQTWFDRLLARERNGYRAPAGARAAFRLSRPDVEALKNAAEHKQPEEA